jgi:hypothetical protein
LRIDPAVLPLRDIDDAIGIIDPHHNAILVAGEIFLLRAFEGPDAGTAAVLVDEFDASMQLPTCPPCNL